MNAASRPLVSIVCPAFNEELVVLPFQRALVEALASLEAEYRFEIIYVDDGSSDGTLAVLKSIAAGDRRVRWLRFSRNFGHQAALSAGMEKARGEAVITLDSDLQHPPELIGALLAKWREGYDVVVTVRGDDLTLSMFKRWTSTGFYHVLRWLSETKIPIATADYRLLSRRACDSLLQMREVHRFLRGMVHWLGFKTAEIRYVPGVRAAGTSHYSLRKMLRLAGDGIFAFSMMPLRWITTAGLLTLALGFAAPFALAFLSIAGAEIGPPILAVFLVTTLILGGAILLGLGIVGEYVGRTLEQVKSRPVFVIADSSEEPPAVARSEAA